MTRQEQLYFCRKCLNRKMDLKQGLLCSLTGNKATFHTECPDFKLDETVKDRPKPLDNEWDDRLAEQKEVQSYNLSPEVKEKLKTEQRLLFGVLSGLVVGLIGAICWGVFTVATGYQIGYMAIAVGAGVGFTIRKIGRGIDVIFGVLGAGIALFSVLLGNFLSVIGFIAQFTGLGYFEILLAFDYSYLSEAMGETFSAIDLLFYGIAIYAGYRYSFRKISEKTVAELEQKER